jgi:Ca2+-binding RTX toxin-like protein
MKTITGKARADFLRGGLLAEKILGLAGNDIIFGGGGNDVISGGAGNDAIHGDAGSDTINGDAGNDSIHGDSGDDNVTGGAGNDRLFGDAGDDRLSGDGENDLLYGGAGNDTLVDTSGIDAFYGGADIDTVDYSGMTAGRGVDVHLNLGIGGRDAAQDKYVSIENVIGTSFDDFLWGTDSANTLTAGGGNDYLRGFGGNDVLIGGEARDIMFGDAGDDTLFIGDGNDIADGGAGYDWLDFSDTGKVDIDYPNGNKPGGPYTPFDPVTHIGDQVYNIEGLRGSAQDDNLLFEGAPAGTTLFDALDGGAGMDWIGGANRYYGGAGLDHIILDAPPLAGPGRAETVHLQLDQGIDSIAYFRQGEDKLEIARSEFGLATDGLGNTIFDFVTVTDSNEATSGTASFIYESTTHILWFDADGTGDGVAPIALAQMFTGGSVTLADLIFVG